MKEFLRKVGEQQRKIAEHGKLINALHRALPAEINKMNFSKEIF